MLSKLKLFLRAKRPEILLGSGILLICGGTIWACNSSRKLDEVLDEAEDKIEEAKLSDKSDQEYSKEAAKIRLECAGKLGKMYAGPAGLFVGGMYLVVKSHCDLRSDLKDVSKLLAETAAVFGAYRGRVKAELGQDADNRFMYGSKSYELKKESYVDEEGKEHPGETIVYHDTVDTSKLDYSIIFDERSAYFDRENPENNIRFVYLAEEDLLRELMGTGFLFNDRIKARFGLEKEITAEDRKNGFLCGPADKVLDDNGNKLFSVGLYNALDRQKRVNGELGNSFILYPTSYGVGACYIMDLFEKAKKL